MHIAFIVSSCEQYCIGLVLVEYHKAAYFSVKQDLIQVISLAVY